MDVLQEAFLDKLKAIGGISTVETQTYTLEEACEELLCPCAFSAFVFVRLIVGGLSDQRAHNAGGSSLCECVDWVDRSTGFHYGDSASHLTDESVCQVLGGSHLRIPGCRRSSFRRTASDPWRMRVGCWECWVIV